ncbi:type IV pilin protein [Desulforhabdus amnigena]|uniref:Prepilin-type N-terminal cleavage/methylation domain-containing protein n=1 Tax=Desulforhabdus amnigena TaxID=40218 RepID=A0A9W6FVT0_9BACT|nr:type IV pilin protein [Desulforhabdus amnigena]GLI35738.1 hypothetical protein DAMNIGENAA_31710 [Desulforhabdus amnigena]
MKKCHTFSTEGFTLVELMVVVAITAILASVAVPAYINHINRVKQSEAASQLLTARIEMEEFLLDNNRYAGTIGCLPSFNSNPACLASCSACTQTTHKLKYYSFFIENASTTHYRIASTRKIYSYAQTDKLIISASTQTPKVLNEDALKFSVYKWLFD